MDNSKADTNMKTSDQRMLLKIARESLDYFMKTGEKIFYDESVLPKNLLTSHGAFVSLYKGKALRGCVGRIRSDKSVYLLVQDLVIAAAQKDKRFLPVKFGELRQIRIEISLLSELKRIHDYSEVVLGVHGIYIRKDHNTGTFLPQVAEATGWNKEEFLSHCSKDKAGIGSEGWKTAELFVYTAEVFRE